jgi:hypothetical protein
MAEHPLFQSGFYGLAWGAPVSRLDFWLAKDSSWSHRSSMGERKDGGHVVEVHNKNRDYYLEFTEKDQFCLVNYISDQKDLDSVLSLLTRNCGVPDKSELTDGNFENKMWWVENDSVNLEIQLLVTKNNYSLSVSNRNIRP